MNSRIYTQDVYDKHYYNYLHGLLGAKNLYIPVKPITQVDIIQIKISINLQVITQLIDKINNKHCQ